jgi:hypothetical protein
VTFTGTSRTGDISHGEMLRDGDDQNLEIDTYNLQYLYRGTCPSASGIYNVPSWRLGLLTQTNGRVDPAVSSPRMPDRIPEASVARRATGGCVWLWLFQGHPREGATRRR